MFLLCITRLCAEYKLFVCTLDRSALEAARTKIAQMTTQMTLHEIVCHPKLDLSRHFNQSCVSRISGYKLTACMLKDCESLKRI